MVGRIFIPRTFIRGGLNLMLLILVREAANKSFLSGPTDIRALVVALIRKKTFCGFPNIKLYHSRLRNAAPYKQHETQCKNYV